MFSTTENYFKLRFVPTNVIPKIFISAIALIIIILNASPVYSVTCTPASAQLCAAVDDTADIYINGTLVSGAFPYCNVEPGGAGCTPRCVALTPAELLSLQPTGNVISVRTLNTGYAEIWASWSLNIVCASGGHSYVSSGSGAGIDMYYDSSACPADPAPVDGTGKTWYDPFYNKATSGASWVPPAVESGQKFGKRIFDPQTGNLLPALSYDVDSATTDGDCKQIFFRQGFDLPEEPTPVPPTLTIVKSANPAANYGQSTPYDITFTLHICNTGGGTVGNPVTIADNWTDSLDNFDWQWPNSNIYDSVFGEIQISRSGKTMSLLFKDGFPGNSCYDFQYALKPNGGSNNNTGAPYYCEVWHNIADLSYLAEPVKRSTVTITNYCPPTPVFSLVKTASTTTITGTNQNINYSLALCNTGGAAWNGSMFIQDDMSSAPGNWNFTSSTDMYAPAPGIERFRFSTDNPSARQYRIEVIFKYPGFTGCVNIPFTIQSQSPYGCGPWFNSAKLESYLGLPTIVSTVDMLNVCSPTFTPTFTRTITPSRTMTLTMTSTYTRTVTSTVGVPSNTFTRTSTPTYTRTNTPTFTMTPQPTMDITKTANVGVATFGDTITYTLSYHNTGSVTANPVCIYDTVPSALTYIGSSQAPTTGAPFLSWCVGSVAPGGSGTITWWGRITAYPLNPLFEMKMYLGEIMIYKNEVIATYKEYENQSLAFLSYVIRE